MQTNCLGCKWLLLLKDSPMLALYCERYTGSGKVPEMKVLGKGQCKRKGRG